MKKIMGMLAFLCVIGLTGCGDNGEKVIGGEVANNSTEASAEQSKETDNTQEETAGKGYVFSFRDAKLEMDAEFAPILAVIGEPLSYFEAASCAFEGLDKIYTYSSVVINTYPQGDKDYVSSIILQDDSVSTSEGICIGSTKEDMLNAYGDSYAEESGMIVYAKDGMKLCFIVSDDIVTSIQYFSTVLDE